MGRSGSPMETDDTLRDVRLSIKSCRKEVVEAQRSSLEETLENNQQAVQEQIKLQRHLLEKIPKFQGEWYPSRPARPAEAQAKTVDAKFQRTQVTLIEPLGFDRTIPKYAHWTPIRRNYRVEDDPVLRFLPYFSDDDNDTFDYLSYFDSTSLVEDDREDEFRVEIALKILRKYHISDKQFLDNFGETKSLDMKTGDDRINSTMHSFARIFKVDADSLIERLVDYFQKKARAVEHAPTPTKTIDNVDNPNADVKVDQCLDSFLNLFCRRCFRYDCQLHGVTADLYYKNKGKMAEHIHDAKPPCGPNCYKHIVIHSHRRHSQDHSHGHPHEHPHDLAHGHSQALSQSATVPTAATSSQHHQPPLVTSLPSNPHDHSHASGSPRKSPQKRARHHSSVGWSNVELILLAKAREVFHKNNYCDMALTVSTKTCAQVYEYLHESEALKVEPMDPLNTQRQARDEKVGRKQKKRRRLNLIGRQSRKVPNLQRVGDSDSLVEYSPCNHDGPCDERCSCVSSNNYCEKFCLCDSSCKNRFPGCRCKRTCDTRQCPCFAALRECDPDVCGNCGAAEDINKKSRCHNVSLQRCLKKHTVVGESDIAGWGLFLLESAKKNELIGEYMGEIISQEEADRRGKVYDKHAVSFLFNLNQDYCVDAHRKGNKLRFANHSISPNCYARVTMVSGDYRIGIFAKHDINAGDELFFDYRYGDEALKFVPVELANVKQNQDASSDDDSSGSSDYD